MTAQQQQHIAAPVADRVWWRIHIFHRRRCRHHRRRSSRRNAECAYGRDLCAQVINNPWSGGFGAGLLGPPTPPAEYL